MARRNKTRSYRKKNVRKTRSRKQRGGEKQCKAQGETCIRSSGCCSGECTGEFQCA